MRAHATLRLLLALTIGGCTSAAAPSASTPMPPSAGPSVPATAAPSVTPVATSIPSPTAAPDPTPEPEPTPGESRPASASLWAQHPPAPLLVGAAVRVTVDELNLRARPDTSAKITGSVMKGWLLAVTSMPPVEADGYIWYQGRLARTSAVPPILPTPILELGDPPGGYFAASKGATPYVTPIAARCPSVIDVINVLGMLPAERLECFTDDTIEVEGSYGCANCISHIFGDYEPSWLADPNNTDLLWADPMHGLALRLRFPPAGPERPDEGHLIRFRGHFGDAAAGTCSIEMDYWWDDDIENHVVPDVVARMLCRQEFVVDSYEVIGPDPRWAAL